MKKFTEALPEYLSGPIVERLGDITDTSLLSTERLLLLLKTVQTLERPILIERYQNMPGEGFMRVHVHVDSPIREVYVTGWEPVEEEAYVDDTLEEAIPLEYSESDAVTDLVFVFPIYANYHEHGQVYAAMPMEVVHVKLWDGREFSKGYPENDSPVGDEYDKDEVLDRIGALLGIPRRIQKDLTTTAEPMSFWEIYPAFWTKVDFPDADDIILEDDWYYYKRLDKFMREFGSKTLVELLCELTYEASDVSVEVSENRDTFIYPAVSGRTGGLVYLLIWDSPYYTNIDYSTMDELLSGYVPVTRPLLVVRRRSILWDVDNLILDGNQFSVDVGAGFNDGSWVPVERAKFVVTHWNELRQTVKTRSIYTEEDGEKEYSDTCHNDCVYLKFRLEPEYECLNGNDYEAKIYLRDTGELVGYRDNNVTVASNENSTTGFDLQNWTGSGSITTNSDGTLSIVNTKYYKNFPTGDWVCVVDLEQTSDSLVLYYYNTVDGNVRLNSKSNDTCNINSTTVDKFITTSNRRNKLRIIKKGNKVTMAYKSNDTGDYVKYEMDYSSISILGRFAVSGGELKVHSIVFDTLQTGGGDNMNELDITKAENWTFTERGEESTSPTFTDDATIELGRYTHHIWKQQLNTDTIYNIYFNIPSATYRTMNVGVCNSDTAPTRYPTVPPITANGGVDGINKATIFYDETTSYWYVAFNDNIAIQQLDNTNARYILVNTPNGGVNNHRILAITTEPNNGGGGNNG